MNNENCGTSSQSCGPDSKGCCCFKCGKRFSWSAPIVGALVGIGLSFLLNLFSIAIGLSIVTTTTEGAVSLAVGGFIGLLIGTIASTFASGMVAGYLGRRCNPGCGRGVLYGFTAWCLALLLLATLARPIGYYVAAYSNFISSPTAVVAVNNEVSPAVSTQSTPRGNKVAVVNVQKTVNNLGHGALLVFLLFFVGAISACLGGHSGSNCCRRCKSCGQNNCNCKK